MLELSRCTNNVEGGLVGGMAEVFVLGELGWANWTWWKIMQ